MMDIDLIVKTLNEPGKVVVIKTDTVYGLICNAFDKLATEKIYRIKNRESKKPLSIFIKNVDELNKYIDSPNLNDKINNIVDKYWPGALTIIFKKKNSDLEHISEDHSGIGIRIPNDRDLLSILEKVDFPLAETSCNLSGEKEYKNVNEIRDKMGSKIDLIDMIVDGGEIKNNVPSTVISVENGNILILRSGDIKLDLYDKKN